MLLSACRPARLVTSFVAVSLTCDSIYWPFWFFLLQIQKSFKPSLLLVNLLWCDELNYSQWTQFHWWGLFWDCISPILFKINGLNVLLGRCICHNTLMMSDQNVISRVSISNDFDIVTFSLNPRNAPNSSKWGIVVDLRVATLDLKVTRRTETAPSLCLNLLYTTVPSTFGEASTNVCRLHIPVYRLTTSWLIEPITFVPNVLSVP